METLAQRPEEELVREVEAAKEAFPGARIKVRRGHVVVVSEDLIVLEPFVWGRRMATRAGGSSDIGPDNAASGPFYIPRGV
jgi:hypothetical protein